MEHNFNFLPEKVVSTTDSEGKNLFSRVYTLEAWGNLTILQLIFLFILIGVLSPFASLILLICYCVESNRLPYAYNILGILVSVYLLMDIHFNWLLGPLIRGLFTDIELHRIIYLNGTMILTHLILLLFGKNLLRLAEERIREVMLLYVIVIAVSMIPVAKLIFSHNLINIS